MAKLVSQLIYNNTPSEHIVRQRQQRTDWIDSCARKTLLVDFLFAATTTGSPHTILYHSLYFGLAFTLARVHLKYIHIVIGYTYIFLFFVFFTVFATSGLSVCLSLLLFFLIKLNVVVVPNVLRTMERRQRSIQMYEYIVVVYSVTLAVCCTLFKHVQSRKWKEKKKKN